MSISAITPDEVLAIIRIRQWSCDRASLRAARTTDYQRSGWQARSNRQCDAKLVRVIDFEKALAQLSQDEQAVLLLAYRERQLQPDTAKALRCSVRKISYLLPAARKHLADVLDRMDIL